MIRATLDKNGRPYPFGGAFAVTIPLLVGAVRHIEAGGHAAPKLAVEQLSTQCCSLPEALRQLEQCVKAVRP
jgi:hypothetical protein